MIKIWYPPKFAELYFFKFSVWCWNLLSFTKLRADHSEKKIMKNLPATFPMKKKFPPPNILLKTFWKINRYITYILSTRNIFLLRIFFVFYGSGVYLIRELLLLVRRYAYSISAYISSYIFSFKNCSYWCFVVMIFRWDYCYHSEYPVITI